ncbi:SET domain-containing protein [Pedobacter sp. Du54]|uniref:SET domain-containing protein n=1 Tax=Pedobacter anseongensis TaxID=3133439 RepID=UPI0030A9A9A3
MLLVETFIQSTSKKGLGLFAKSFLPKGTVYWKRNEEFDRLFTVEQFAKLDPIAADYISYDGFLETTGNWYLCGDNARFSNHSSTPNTKNNFDVQNLIVHSVVSVDVEAGEELLIDYTEICQTCIDGVAFESHF